MEYVKHGQNVSHLKCLIFSSELKLKSVLSHDSKRIFKMKYIKELIMKSLIKASTLVAAGILTSQLFAVSAQAALPDSCEKDAKGH